MASRGEPFQVDGTKLVQEMGAYERAIETLLAQPRQIVRENSIHELLALTYYHNGMPAEVKTIFDRLTRTGSPMPTSPSRTATFRLLSS